MLCHVGLRATGLRVTSLQDDINNKTIEIEAKFKIEIRSWDMQRPEGLMHLSKKPELDKLNDQVLDS